MVVAPSHLPSCQIWNVLGQVLCILELKTEKLLKAFWLFCKGQGHIWVWDHTKLCDSAWQCHCSCICKSSRSSRSKIVLLNVSMSQKEVKVNESYCWCNASSGSIKLPNMKCISRSWPCSGSWNIANRCKVPKIGVTLHACISKMVSPMKNLTGINTLNCKLQCSDSL